MSDSSKKNQEMIERAAKALATYGAEMDRVGKAANKWNREKEPGRKEKLLAELMSLSMAMEENRSVLGAEALRIYYWMKKHKG